MKNQRGVVPAIPALNGRIWVEEAKGRTWVELVKGRTWVVELVLGTAHLVGMMEMKAM